MDRNQKISSVIAYILMGVAMAAVVYSMFSSSQRTKVIFNIASAANLLALICGIIYTAKGSTKNAALWLKCFEGFAGVSILATVAKAASVGASPVSIVLRTLSFGLLCILCYAENLGKKRSFLIGAALIALEAVSVIKSLTASKIRFGRIVNISSQLIVLVVLVLLIVHKYQDKEKRNTI